MLKHLPKGDLKTIQKTFLCSKKPVYYRNTAYKRRNFNSSDPTTTGLNANQIANLKKKIMLKN